MVSAFILAGGKSTRMGADKAFLVLNGRTLLERALELARVVTSEVRIVGKRSKFAAYGETVEDIFPGCGPLGGIHAALSASDAELNLILAVDTPLIEADFLRYEVAVAEQSAALVTVPRLGEAARDSRPRRLRSEFLPLCAVYRRGFRALAEAALRACHNKIDPLFTPEITRIIDGEELARLSFPGSMFDNLNTREEFERAQALQRGGNR